MIHECAPLLPEDAIRRAKALSVPLLLDGVKAAKLDIPNGGCMDMHINPVARGMKTVGTALTVEAADGDNLAIHLASCLFDARGYVMVIDGKANETCAYCGDLIMGACQATGYEGMVIDGCTRDRDGNIELGFPVFSRGFMPRGPVRKDEGNVNTPIRCGGVDVCPGDLVMGDSDGVCVIPARYVETVLNEAEKKLAYEQEREAVIAAYRAAVRTGAPRPQLAPRWMQELLK